MRWGRIVGTVAVFLAMSGSMLGSNPEKRLQVRWSKLKKVIRGKIVTLQLADGTQVKGGASQEGEGVVGRLMGQEELRLPEGTD